jgi:hypothetical protein
MRSVAVDDVGSSIGVTADPTVCFELVERLSTELVSLLTNAPSVLSGSKLVSEDAEPEVIVVDLGILPRLLESVLLIRLVPVLSSDGDELWSLESGDVVFDTMLVLVIFFLLKNGSTDEELESAIVILDCDGVVGTTSHAGLVLVGTCELAVEFDHSGAVLEEVNASVICPGSTYELAAYELEAIDAEVPLSSVSVALVLTIGTSVVLLSGTLVVLGEYCGVSCCEILFVGSPLADIWDEPEGSAVLEDKVIIASPVSDLVVEEEVTRSPSPLVVSENGFTEGSDGVVDEKLPVWTYDAEKLPAVVELVDPGWLSVVLAVNVIVASELDVELEANVIESTRSDSVQLEDPGVAAVSSILMVLPTGWKLLLVVFSGAPDRVLDNVVVRTAHSVELLLVLFPGYMFVRVG